MKFVSDAVKESAPLALVTDYLVAGGVSSFVRNLGSGLCQLGIQKKLPVIVLEATDVSEVNSMPDCDVRALDIAMRRNIREDRLAAAHGMLSRLQPSGVIAALGMWSFEMLRYIPMGVARIAMIQSDDALVYCALLPYRPYLDYLVCVSPEISRRAVEEFGFPRDIVRTIPYGVPHHTVHRTPNDGPKALHLLYLGRIIEEQKRVSRLVELVRALDQHAVPFQLTVAGEGPASADLESKLGSHPHVQFTGQVPKDRVPELLARNDFLVLLSDYEGMPLSVLEAAACSVVPVVTNLPGFAEWLPDDIAVYVKAQSPDWPVDATTALVSVAADLEERQSRCRAWAQENFSIAKMAATHAALLPAREKAPWPDAMISPPLAAGIRTPIYHPIARFFRRMIKRI